MAFKMAAIFHFYHNSAPRKIRIAYEIHMIQLWQKF